MGQGGEPPPEKGVKGFLRCGPWKAKKSLIFDSKPNPKGEMSSR